ncbi:MAG: hypothetical protein ACXAE3_14595 [Candidatus Kariarchaeaceae archaeon]|jgi:hypothetical protein
MVDLGNMRQAADSLVDAIETLQTENNQLKARIAELESKDSNPAPSFDITTSDEPEETGAPSTAPAGPATSESSSSTGTTPVRMGIRHADLPVEGEGFSLGPDSVDETNLEDLLANDALVATVYNRLRPLKELKYRLLAMQMGISVDRCKMAIEKLERAGAVTVDDKEVVTIT